MLESKKTTRYVFYVYLMLLTWGILFKLGESYLSLKQILNL